MAEPNIRVGIGGRDYDPWRGTFYPPGPPRAKQLADAAERLTSIEINGTFYPAAALVLQQRLGIAPA